MAVPFRVDPEPPPRPGQGDPFLEFDSERPEAGAGRQDEPARPERTERPLETYRSSLFNPPVIEPLEPPRPPLFKDASFLAPEPANPKSAISPSVAFALGVAGLVMAIAAYYQLSQFLSDRASAGPEATAPSTAAQPGSGATTGRLEVRSDPAGATVTVDGVEKGVTPLVLADVPAGRREIVVRRGRLTVNRAVELGAGGTADVVVLLGSATASPAPNLPAAVRPATPNVAPGGWVTFDSPIELRIFDRGRLRGTTESGRVSLPSGSHQLELVNDAFEIRQMVSATIGSGQSTRLSVPLPKGSLSINAIPWAIVWVDGKEIGTTPLANLALTVGPHELVFRHPTLGERRQTANVTARTPSRIGVNLNR